MGSAAGHGHGHGHRVGQDTDRRALVIALALIVVFMAGEVLIGVVAQSLALLSDAAHMLTDAGSILLAIIAIRLAARPPGGDYTYGLKRVEILSAQANGLTLLLLAAWLGYEAIRRLVDPPPVAGGLVVVTALVGVVVNIAATWCLSKANRSSLNVEGAFQHLLTDLYGFVATAVAGVIVLSTGFVRADAIAALVVVALMVRAGVGLVHQSGRIFLEAAPAGIDTRALGGRLAAHPDVVEVHDLHVWQITSGQPALSAHVLVAPGRDCHAVRTNLQTLLAHDYAITHVTLQLDHPPPDLFTITRAHAEEHGHCTDRPAPSADNNA